MAPPNPYEVAEVQTGSLCEARRAVRQGLVVFPRSLAAVEFPTLKTVTRPRAQTLLKNRVMDHPLHRSSQPFH
jgi:hypothetical protein